MKNKVILGQSQWKTMMILKTVGLNKAHPLLLLSSHSCEQIYSPRYSEQRLQNQTNCDLDVQPCFPRQETEGNLTVCYLQMLFQIMVKCSPTQLFSFKKYSLRAKHMPILIQAQEKLGGGSGDLGVRGYTQAHDSETRHTIGLVIFTRLDMS